VLVTPTHIFCGNSGDSRSVLARNVENGGVTHVALSDDHKPENELERKRIYAAGGTVSENRVNGNLNLSRSLGDFEYKNNKSKSYKEQMVTCLPDITKNERHSSDKFIVVACDGIWDCLSNDACVELVDSYLKRRTDLSNLAQTSKCIELMFDSILAKDLSSGGAGTDNMTCLVVEFKG
jgi:serine/threonine protein phosphatase PrpC